MEVTGALREVHGMTQTETYTVTAAGALIEATLAIGFIAGLIGLSLGLLLKRH